MDARVLIPSGCLIVLALVAACDRRSEKYCELHPTDLAFCPRTDAPTDAPTMCMSNAECAPADPFCEPTSHICVECLTSADCTSHPAAPNCNPTTFACQGCLSHLDCPSGACLPDGTCGDDASVIYVSDQGRDGAGCTAAAPCATINHAATALTPTRQYIKLSGNLIQSATLTSKRATILADPTTTLTGTADPALKLQMSEVRIFDLAVTCPAVPAITGIKSEMESTTTLTRVTIRSCGKKGLEGKGGYLRVTRSTIAQNLEAGISLDANSDFSITNTFIYLNGSPSTKGGGGVAIAAPTSGNNQFEFNTVANNVGMDTGGVTCPTTNFLVAPNNLIVENTPANTLGCDFAQSRVEADITPFAFAGANDYHITALSAARDAATAPSTVNEDFDGQYRPLGTAKDVGADEYKP